MSLSKTFFFGLGVGVALTMVTLEIWGRYLDREIVLNANPWMLQPFRQQPVQEMPKSSEKLPRPVLPTDASAAHDHWTFHPLGGKPTTIGDFKGKVVFLNFWSTSCGPCIAEMPGIERLQASLRSEPVAFLAVTQESAKRASLPPEIPFACPSLLGWRRCTQGFWATISSENIHPRPQWPGGLQGCRWIELGRRQCAEIHPRLGSAIRVIGMPWQLKLRFFRG